MDIIKGKRYGFYMQENPKDKYVTALYTGEEDKDNGNLILMNKGLVYSIPKEDLIEIKK